MTGTAENRSNTTIYLYALFGICFLGGVFGGITGTLMSSYLPDVVKALTGNTDQEKMEQVSAVINAVFLFGMTFGGLSLGYFCDHFGRKKAVLLSLVFIGLFTLLTSFSQSWLLVVAFRFFTGFGVGGILVTTAILIAEEWADQKRNIALGILSITFPVGIFSTGLITYNFTDWRIGFLSGIFPLFLAIIGHFFIKESKKWKQDREAQPGLQKRQSSIFQQENAYDLLYGSIIYGAMLIGLWAVLSWLPTWIETIVKDSESQQARGISMMLFAGGGLLGGFISGWVSNLLGMKKAILICFAATFVLSMALFQLNTTLSLFSYIEIALIALFFGLSQGVLNAYIPALFPTRIRTTAAGFCFNIGRIFTASAVFFVGWLVNFLGGYGNALTIFSFVFLLGFLITLKVKEKQLVQ